MSLLKRNTFCSACKGIYELKPTQPSIVVTKDWKQTSHDERPITRVHYDSFDEFATSAKAECHLCLLLFNRIPLDLIQLLNDPSPERSQMAVTYASNQQVSVFDLEVWYPFSARIRLSQRSMGFKITLHLWPEGDPDNSLILFNPQLSSTSGENLIPVTAFNWLSNCVNSHDLCKPQAQSERILPSRLIEIGTAADLTDVRLCSTNEAMGEIIYIALSHCWGKSKMVTLTEKLHEQFCKSITFGSLSKTFQHAILTARELRSKFNVRFIWIDSLCIIQDSKSDWKRESGKMGQVYKNAFCVISATGGQDGSSGLFFERNPLSLYPVSLKLEWDGGSKGSYTCENRRAFQYIDESPLFRRGWVVQERALARRVLHFTPQQIYWECFTMDATEAHPKKLSSLGRPISKYWTPQDFRRHRDFGKFWQEKNHEFEAYIIWSSVLHQYTRCRLTRSIDKLAAVSGVAKEMQRYLAGNDSYVAGLWKKFLVQELLWEVEPSPCNSRASHYRAPSWSWAAVDAPLLQNMWPNRDFYKTMADISTVEVVATDDDPFLALKSGFITVTGLLVKVHLIPGRRGGGAVLGGLYEPRTFLGPGTLDFDLRLNDTNKDVALCMPFISQGDLKGEDGTALSKALIGILLKKTLDGKCEYERCGILNIEKDNCEGFLKACQSFRLREGEFDALDLTSNRYTVTIV